MQNRIKILEQTIEQMQQALIRQDNTLSEQGMKIQALESQQALKIRCSTISNISMQRIKRQAI